MGWLINSNNAARQESLAGLHDAISTLGRNIAKINDVLAETTTQVNTLSVLTSEASRLGVQLQTNIEQVKQHQENIQTLLDTTLQDTELTRNMCSNFSVPRIFRPVNISGAEMAFHASCFAVNSIQLTTQLLNQTHPPIKQQTDQYIQIARERLSHN